MASAGAAAAVSRRSPSRLSESAAVPDPDGGGDGPDVPTKVRRQLRRTANRGMVPAGA